MKRTLSHTLWIAAVASLSLAGCSTPKNDGSRDTVVAASETTDLPLTEASADPDIALDSDEGAVLTADAEDESVVAEEPRPEPGLASKAEVTSGVTSAAPRRESKSGAGHYGTKDRRVRVARAPHGRATLQIAGPQPSANTEGYTRYAANPFVVAAKDHLSTFAVDVDTASYAIARRKIIDGVVPPAASVRVEEFVNYFSYDYAAPTDGAPFAVHMDMAPSPFTKDRHILRVGVQGKRVSMRDRKPSHLVFLVDVSGSMTSADKLGLAKRALRILVDNLKENDTVALVTYAGSTRVVLEPTGMAHKAKILGAIEDLSAGGSTAMASGIELAYDLAAQKLGSGSESRVIVLSDGDANVGNTSHEAILATISGKVKEGVTLSTIGFGMGNYKDTMMEQLANKGNGNYYYIDGLSEARKVFQEQLGGTLEVIAKDVKLQVDFDEDVVSRYRLVGYENRDVADRDFRNDKVDAGEIGAGHTVTALYELELAKTGVSPVTVRVRAKRPRGSKASERAYAFDTSRAYPSFDAAPADFRFATAVMATAEILRGSEHSEGWRVADVRGIARATAGDDPIRKEFVALLGRVGDLESKIALAR